MPSCRSFNNFNGYSSSHRWAMREKKSNNTVRNLLEVKSSHSRSTRQQGSFVIEFRRWLLEFWNFVINRLKSVFSNSRNLQTRRSLTSKITNMDSDHENTFWREGGPCYIQKYNYPKIKRKISNTKDRVVDSDSRTRNHRNAAPIYSVSYKNNQRPNARRRSTKEISNFNGTETTDEEYFALYKKLSRDKDTDKSNEKNFSISSGDCVFEPIETILSRYQPKKSSKSTIELNSESSIEPLGISDEIKSKEEPRNYLRLNYPESMLLKSSDDDTWNETNYFGSVRYSKSELNITSEGKSVTSTRNQVSKIPRLRHLPEKRNSRAYCTNNDIRPRSVRQ